jgi:hypothetical protein
MAAGAEAHGTRMARPNHCHDLNLDKVLQRRGSFNYDGYVQGTLKSLFSKILTSTLEDSTGLISDKNDDRRIGTIWLSQLPQGMEQLRPR